MTVFSLFARAALPALVLTTLAAAPPRPTTPFDLRTSVGRPIPALTLPTVDGGTIDTGAFRGRPTYVVLLASWCEPCRSALPHVLADHLRFGDRVRFVGIDVYEDAEHAAAFARAQRLPFPVAVFTQDQLDAAVPLEVRERAGTRYNIPADVLVDGDGIVRAAWYGVQGAPDGTPLDPLPGALRAMGIE